MTATDIATAVYTAPTEVVHIDWYDGIVQAVFLHDDHGAFYAFAVPLEALRAAGGVETPALGERLVCMRPIADRSVLPELEDLDTVDDETWLTSLGTGRLLPACAPSGVLLVTSGAGVASARELHADELASLAPVEAQELYA